MAKIKLSRAVVHTKTGHSIPVWVSLNYSVNPESYTKKTILMFPRRGWFESGVVFVQGSQVDCVELLDNQ